MTTRHFINLTNGLQAIEEHGLDPRDVRFIRIQSTWCEQKANNEAAMLRHRLVLAEFHAKRMEVFAMTAAQRADAIQAKLDALMLEYCPDEMTPEQLSNWERRQRPVSDEEQANIEAAIMGSNK